MSKRARKRTPSTDWKETEALITDEARAFVRLTADLQDRLQELMAAQNMTQKDLADLLGKSPSEVNRYFQLGYNFTLKTVGKLEAALQSPLLVAPWRQQARGEANLFGGNKELDHYRALVARSLAALPEMHQQLIGGGSINLAQGVSGVVDSSTTDEQQKLSTKFAMAA